MVAPVIAAGAATAGQVAARGAQTIAPRAAIRNGRRNYSRSATQTTSQNSRPSDPSYKYQTARDSSPNRSAIAKQRTTRKQQTADPTARRTQRHVHRAIPRLIKRQGVQADESAAKRAAYTAKTATIGVGIIGSYVIYWPVQIIATLIFFLGFWYVYIDDSITGMVINLFPTQLLMYGGWIIGAIVGVVTHVAAALALAPTGALTRSGVFWVGTASFILSIIPFTMFIPWLVTWVLIAVVSHK